VALARACSLNADVWLRGGAGEVRDSASGGGRVVGTGRSAGLGRVRIVEWWARVWRSVEGGSSRSRGLGWNGGGSVMLH
jgi:hypothetical protein